MSDEYLFLKTISEELHKVRGFLYNGQVIPADRSVQGIHNKIQNRVNSLKQTHEDQGA